MKNELWENFNKYEIFNNGKDKTWSIRLFSYLSNEQCGSRAYLNMAYETKVASNLLFKSSIQGLVDNASKVKLLVWK